MMTRVVAESDAVITTAAVPGKRAPTLITRTMVEGMRPGAVILDMAAETGGNCELTNRGETIELNGVKVIGPVNLPGSIPHHASQMYSKNISEFLQNLLQNGEVSLNTEDPIIKDSLLTHRGEITSNRIREILGLEETQN
jgi:NAD(P) transhydrogenase subunit alpha